MTDIPEALQRAYRVAFPALAIVGAAARFARAWAQQRATSPEMESALELGQLNQVLERTPASLSALTVLLDIVCCPIAWRVQVPLWQAISS
jgi:hypothetical protein